MAEAEKRKLTYAIEPQFEDQIRSFVDEENKNTGKSKLRIVTDLILIGIKVKEQTGK